MCQPTAGEVGAEAVNIEVRVVQVLAAGPFCEIGNPAAVAVSSSGLIAVGGELGNLEWSGLRPRGFRRHRVAVYVDPTLECRRLVQLRWRVNDLAFSSDGSVLAIATGSYDGGYSYEGELVIVDVVSGRTASLLTEEREVLAVSWLRNGAIEATLQRRSDQPPNDQTRITIAPATWSGFNDRAVTVADYPAEVPEAPQPRPSPIPLLQESRSQPVRSGSYAAKSGDSRRGETPFSPVWKTSPWKHGTPQATCSSNEEPKAKAAKSFLTATPSSPTSNAHIDRRRHELVAAGTSRHPT